MRRRADRRRQRGAVLLLLLIVLGLGAASVLISAFGKTAMDGARQHRTALVLAQANDALLGFSAAYGRLPRPAISALDGHERRAPCPSDAACTGFLPWVTLGVAGNDAWGKLVRYSVTPEYTLVPDDPANLYGDKTVLSRGADGELLILAGRGGCLLGRCAPVVVWSNGSHNLGTSVAGQALANGSGTNLDEVANDSSSTTFIKRPASDDDTLVGGEYDDVVSWLGRDVLLARMTAGRRTH